MKAMTQKAIRELNKRKADLEKDLAETIQAKLREFEDDTGVPVGGVSVGLSVLRTIDGQAETVLHSVGVELAI